MADEKSGRPAGSRKSQGRRSSPAGGFPAGGSRGQSWMSRILGQPGDRRTRLIAVGGVVVVLLVLGIYAVVNQRATERRNLEQIGTLVQQNRAVARFSVIQQKLTEGVVTTELRWLELDPSGAQGNEQTVLVSGETMHVGVSQGSLTHRRLEAPVEIRYFSHLAGDGGETVELLGPRLRPAISPAPPGGDSPGGARGGGGGKLLEVWFSHLNHTNPLWERDSPERRRIEEAGFGVAQRAQTWEL